MKTNLELYRVVMLVSGDSQAEHTLHPKIYITANIIINII